MTRKQVVQVLMLQATIISLIDQKESTKTSNKFRRQIRKALNHIYKHENSFYEECAKDTNDIWNKVKEEINDDNYKITVSNMMIGLNLLIENEAYTKKFYTQKSLDKFLGSIMARSKIDDDEYFISEKDGNYLTDAFARHLGIVRNNELKRRFWILRQNAIIEKG